jgi:hypothetical protein
MQLLLLSKRNLGWRTTSAQGQNSQEHGQETLEGSATAHLGKSSEENDRAVFVTAHPEDKS